MSEAKRLRRPAEGGYARGDETRLRLILVNLMANALMFTSAGGLMLQIRS